MSNELNQTSEIPQLDPIVVVKKEDGFHVVSGNRRVSAYKAMLMNKLWVSEIDLADHSKYKLNLFFRSQTNDEDTPVFLITMISDMLSYLDLSIPTLRMWSTIEKNKVFGSLFGPMSKIRYLLDIVMIEELKGAVCTLSSMGLKLSGYLYREILRKNKQNPVATLAILNRRWDAESELKKEISKIQPDVRFLLEAKNIQQDVASELASCYAGEKEFLNFVRSTDMRSMSKSSQKRALMEKFEMFKKKNHVTSNINTSHIPIISISPLKDAEFDVLYTANEKIARRALDEHDEIIVLLIGTTVENDPSYVLVLPDQLGIEDDFGRLHNHISFSIFVKVDGKILTESELTSFLRKSGISNRTVFNVSQLGMISEKFRRSFVDIGGVVGEELSFLLVSQSTLIFVENSTHKHRMESVMKHANDNSNVM